MTERQGQNKTDFDVEHQKNNPDQEKFHTKHQTGTRRIKATFKRASFLFISHIRETK